MKRITIIVLIMLIAVGAGIQFYYVKDAPKVSKNRPTPNVVVARAAIEPIREEVEALGTTKANESITVTPKVSEVVTDVNFNDGDLVTKGRLLVQLQDSEQRARVTAAKLKVQENQRELARISSLVVNKTIAELERDRLQTLIDTAKAELAQSESALRDRRITAPFSGALGLRQVSLGAFVTPGNTITTLDDISVIKLDFSVPERFLPDLAVGKVIEASAVAFAGEVFMGEVISIDSRVNPKTRAVTVRATIPNPQLRLLPGMLMKVKLIKQSREALILPESAIIPIQDRHYVYVVNNDGVVEQHQVTLGLRKRGWVEVTQGVALGQQVIIRGLLKVRPGEKVKVTFSERFSFLEQAGGEPIV